MKIVSNRRKSFRMQFVSKLVCHAQGSETPCEGTLRDISIMGLFATMVAGPAVGHPVKVNIFFEGDHSRLVIENVSGKVVRNDREGVGVQFDNRMEWFILIPLFYHKISGKKALEGGHSFGDFL